MDESYAVTHTVVDSSCYSANTSVPDRAWLLDSGCTAHLCGDYDRFDTMSESSNVKLNLASQASTQVKGRGIVHLPVSSNNGYKLFEFKDTLYVPDLRTNLISVAKITNRGHEVTFYKDDAYVRDERGDINVIADRKGDLYVVRESLECAKAAVPSKCSELLKWHERLGHLNARDLIKLIRDRVVPAVDTSDTECVMRCPTCIKGKMSASPFPKGHVPCDVMLETIHSDVVGPFRTESTGRARYFVTYVDDSTRWCEVYFLRQKNGVFDAFKLY